MLGLVSLFNVISNFMGYLMPKAFLKRTVIHSWGNKVFRPFLRVYDGSSNSLHGILQTCTSATRQWGLLHEYKVFSCLK